MTHGPFTKPTSASGYLEAMTKIIMTTGINWKVVESKWEGIRDAFYLVKLLEDALGTDLRAAGFPPAIS